MSREHHCNAVAVVVTLESLGDLFSLKSLRQTASQILVEECSAQNRMPHSQTHSWNPPHPSFVELHQNGFSEASRHETKRPIAAETAPAPAPSLELEDPKLEGAPVRAPVGMSFRV